MADFSLVGGGASALSVGFDLANTRGQAITSGGSANTKGAWVEIQSAAANTSQADSVTVVIMNPAVSLNELFLVDLGVGGAGSEETVLPNLLHFSAGGTSSFSVTAYSFPISLPANERIAIRCQSSAASDTCYAHIIKHSNSLSQSVSYQKAVDYGADTASSSGTLVARSTAGTWGSWTEIVSSTSERIKGFNVGAVRDPNSWSNGSQVAFEVAVGSAGNEEIIYSGELKQMNAAEVSSGTSFHFVPVQVNAGSRLAIRATGNIANADLDLDYIIYGVS